MPRCLATNSFVAVQRQVGQSFVGDEPWLTLHDLQMVAHANQVRVGLELHPQKVPFHVTAIGDREGQKDHRRQEQQGANEDKLEPKPQECELQQKQAKPASRASAAAGSTTAADTGADEDIGDTRSDMGKKPVSVKFSLLARDEQTNSRTRERTPRAKWRTRRHTPCDFQWSSADK